jgi:hypothetical protein
MSEVETLVVTDKTPVVSEKYTSSTKKPNVITPPPVQIKNLIELELLPNESIEIVNLLNGSRNSIMTLTSGKIRLSNTNLYRIPIKNKVLNIDNFYTIKHYAKYSEYFRIVCVLNGYVSIVPIISGSELRHGDCIGELI